MKTNENKTIDENYKTEYADKDVVPENETQIYETIYVKDDEALPHIATQENYKTEYSNEGVVRGDETQVHNFIDNEENYGFNNTISEQAYQQNVPIEPDNNGYSDYNTYDSNYLTGTTQIPIVQNSYQQLEEDYSPYEEKGGSSIFTMVAVLMFSFLLIFLLLFMILYMFVFKKDSDNDKNDSLPTSSVVEQTSTLSTKKKKEKVVTTTARTTRVTTTKYRTTKDPYSVPVVPNEQDYIKTVYVTTDEGPVNFRIGPGYDYDLIGTIPHNSRLEVWAEEYDPLSSETWAYVFYNGESGWVTERWLGSSPKTKATTKAVTTTKKATKATKAPTVYTYDNYNRDDVIEALEDHYNWLLDGDEDYVIFESEYEDGDYYITAILRRHNYDGENEYITEITIDKEDGYVTSDLEEDDSWFIW